MISLSQLFSKTFKALKGHWIQAICIFFVFNFAIAIVQAIPAIGGFLSLIISGPLTIGISVYSLKIINDNFPKAENVLDGFKYNLGNGILAYFILIPMILIVGFILMLVFVLINSIVFGFLISLFYTQSYEEMVFYNQVRSNVSFHTLRVYRKDLLYFCNRRNIFRITQYGINTITISSYALNLLFNLIHFYLILSTIPFCSVV